MAEASVAAVAATGGVVMDWRIKAEMTPWRGVLLARRQSHEMASIAQVLGEAACDAAFEVGRSGALIGYACCRANQCEARHLDQIVAFEQIAEAAVEAARQGIGEGKEAVDECIAPLEGGSGRSHRKASRATAPGPPGRGEAARPSAAAAAVAAAVEVDVHQWPRPRNAVERAIPSAQRSVGPAMQRRAGEQQGLAALMAAAGDNPLTRSWSDLVTGGVIQPVERLLLGPAAESRDTQMRLSRAVVADLSANGGRLSPSMAAVLQEHVDPDADLERLNGATARMDAARLGEEERAVQINTLLAQGTYGPGLVERGDVSESRTAALRQALLAGEPKRASTELGEVMRQYGLGSPVAAYGAVAAAVAGMLAAADALHRGGPEEQQFAEELAAGTHASVSAVG